MYTDAKRRGMQWLLSPGMNEERIAELTGVSVRTIRRIGLEPGRLVPDPAGEPTAPQPTAQRQRPAGRFRIARSTDNIYPFRMTAAAPARRERRLRRCPTSPPT